MPASHSHQAAPPPDAPAPEQALHAAQQAAACAAQQLAAQRTKLARLNQELRTPLNGALGMAAQLGTTPLTTHQQQLVDIIRASGQQLLEVLDATLGPAGPPLPAARVPAPAAPAYDTGQLRGVRLLLVEDNDTNREVARLLLEPWGVLIDEAEDGPAALARLTTHRYDVVLMDIQLPGLSGLDVTRRLRHHPDPQRAAVPVIAFTANALRSDVKTYLAAGLNDCLAKPFDEADLYRKIAAQLPDHPARA